MAAYAATVTSLLRTSKKADAITGVHVFVGEVDITNYNQTLAAIPAISGKFRSVIAVVAGVTSAGYILEWIKASNSFKAYTTPASGALVQLATDVNAGKAQFIAVGLV